MIPTEAWVLPRPRKPYYPGGFPQWFEQRLIKLCGYPKMILHCFAGKAQYGYMVDIKHIIDTKDNARPDIVGDAHRLPFRNNTFDMVVGDPPYDDELSKAMYNTGKISYKRWSREAVRVCKVGGLVVIYHIVVKPRPVGTFYHKRILMEVGHHHKLRWIGIFRKKRGL